MKKLIYFVTILFALFICSCSGGMQEMLDDYNSNFTPYEEENLLPGQDGFEEESMLALIYHVPSSATLCLIAPELPDAKYEWKITTKDNEEIITIIGSRLVLYIPNYEIKPGTYWLTLTVKIGQGGEEQIFTDSSELVIFEDISKM